MKIIEMNIADVKPYENNPRKNDKGVSKIAKSLKEFGWQQPIVVDKNNIIIVGHTRYKAAKKLKMPKVPVLIADNLTDEQAKAYRLADNRLNQDSTWDEIKLHLEFTQLDEKNPKFDFSITGFEGFEVEGIFGKDDEEDIGKGEEKTIKPIFQVLVECKSEQEQQKVYSLVKSHDYKARVISI